MSQPDLSIIIPVYNRGALIKYTLESVRRATPGVASETIVVDDGSAIPATDTIPLLGYVPEQIIRQDNRGLLFARLTGLANATGRYVQFLDSDDLVSPEKFKLQLAAMDSRSADVSYVDAAHCELAGGYDSLVLRNARSLPSTEDSTELFITIQPPPHSPIFRTDYLRQVVAAAPFPPLPLYNPVAEIWFHHIAACHPACVVHVPGPHAIIGSHPESRLTDHWEKLGVASLAVQEAFARTDLSGPLSLRAKQLVAEKAFNAWRRLPRGFSSEFCTRQLNLWHTLHTQVQPAKLGGPVFACVTRILGPVSTGKLFRLLQASDYARVRTMSDVELNQLLVALPPP